MTIKICQVWNNMEQADRTGIKIIQHSAVITPCSA